MPKIERYILLTYQGVNWESFNCESSDARAIRAAIHKLEHYLGMMRGGLIKYFKDNPDDIVVKVK